MEQLRIALADPPRKEIFHYPIFPNLGILYLIGSLRERLGSKCRVLWLDGHQNMTEHLEALDSFRPHIYGISFTYFTRLLAYHAVKHVRRRFGPLPILCGGAMPTAAPREVLESCPADVCVLGEGENTLCELVEYFLDEKSSLSDISGLIYRDQQGSLLTTAKRRPVPDLNSIPFPAWDLVDFARFPGWHMHRGDLQTLVQVSRGCPYDCNFCSNPVWKYSSPWLRYRSPANIRKEVDLLYRMGAREIYLAADEINFSESWAVEVCQVLASLGYEDLFFNCNIRPDIMTNKRNVSMTLRQLPS